MYKCVLEKEKPLKKVKVTEVDEKPILKLKKRKELKSGTFMSCTNAKKHCLVFREELPKLVL